MSYHFLDSDEPLCDLSSDQDAEIKNMGTGVSFLVVLFVYFSLSVCHQSYPKCSSLYACSELWINIVCFLGYPLSLALSAPFD